MTGRPTSEPRRRRWSLRFGAVAALAAVIALLAFTLVGTLGTGGASSPKPTTATTQPSEADVMAARACQAFSVYLSDADKGTIPKAAGSALVDDASALLQGAEADESAGRDEPQWSKLASDLIAAADDVVHHDGKALATDGTAAATQCQSIPAAAAAAGGYVRG